MSKDKNGEGRAGISRRDFLKVSAAGAAAASTGVGLGLMPAPAAAYETGAKTYHTTCPYCSASCGQVIVVNAAGDTVLDIYGDSDSPINQGGLCAKGAGAYQLVTNARRLGVPEHTSAVDGKDMSGTAWVRTGDAAWSQIALATAMTEIAAGSAVAGRVHSGLKTYRGAVDANSNSKGVMFFGCSHMNNEQNYLYRKLVASFGTSNVEHQARI